MHSFVERANRMPGAVLAEFAHFVGACTLCVPICVRRRVENDTEENTLLLAKRR
jgi:hypothetical protein